MKQLLLGLLTVAGIGLTLGLYSTPAYATPCVYGTWHDYATGTTHYVWFHEGEFVGMTPNPTPPPACQPH